MCHSLCFSLHCRRIAFGDITISGAGIIPAAPLAKYGVYLGTVTEVSTMQVSASDGKRLGWQWIEEVVRRWPCSASDGRSGRVRRAALPLLTSTIWSSSSPLG